MVSVIPGMGLLYPGGRGMSRADVLGFSGRQRVIYGRNGLHFQPFFVRISACMALLFLPGKAAMDERAVWKGKGAYERKTFIGFAAAFFFAPSRKFDS